MPIYMDVHADLGDVTEQDIKDAHERDLAIQDKYGVQFLTFWFNSPDGEAFCLVKSVGLFMGNWEKSAPNIARHDDGQLDSGLRAIMFTDLVGSTQISSREGDAAALALLERHDLIVREALSSHAGREVKHTGDGIFASFSHVSAAIKCALEIQHGFGEPKNTDIDEGRLRIGISAGEPVSQHEDLFGAVVNLASRICGHASAGQILVSSAVRELSVGKPVSFVDRGPMALRGFDDPVRLFELPLNQFG